MNSVPIKNISINKMSGNWYEIAKLPFYLEYNLKKSSLTIDIKDDRSLVATKEGISADGFRPNKITCHWTFDDDKILNISYFETFDSEFEFIELDESNYNYFAISTLNRKAYWLFARDRKLDPMLFSKLLLNAENNGVDINCIQKVDQS